MDERTALLLERLQEDESLRGDLEDPAATALLRWADARIREVATDPQRADDVLAADVQTIRQAVRMAAHAGMRDPQQVVAMAAAMLQQTSIHEDPLSPAAMPPAAAPSTRQFRSFRPRRPTPRFGKRRAQQKDHS